MSARHLYVCPVSMNVRTFGSASASTSPLTSRDAAKNEPIESHRFYTGGGIQTNNWYLEMVRGPPFAPNQVYVILCRAETNSHAPMVYGTVKIAVKIPQSNRVTNCGSTKEEFKLDWSQTRGPRICLTNVPGLSKETTKSRATTPRFSCDVVNFLVTLKLSESLDSNSESLKNDIPTVTHLKNDDLVTKWFQELHQKPGQKVTSERLTVETADEVVFYLHTSLVCKESKFLNDYHNNDVATAFEECKSDVLKLRSIDSHTLREVLRYIYLRCKPLQFSNCVFDVLAAAEFLQIDKLKSGCECEIMRQLDGAKEMDISQLIRLLFISDVYNLNQARQCVIDTLALRWREVRDNAAVWQEIKVEALKQDKLNNEPLAEQQTEVEETQDKDQEEETEAKGVDLKANFLDEIMNAMADRMSLFGVQESNI